MHQGHKFIWMKLIIQFMFQMAEGDNKPCSNQSRVFDAEDNDEYECDVRELFQDDSCIQFNRPKRRRELIKEKYSLLMPNLCNADVDTKGPVLTFGDDILSRMIYENALKEGKETDRTIRLMILGCHGQGKSSLARRLLGEPIEDVMSTNGIDIFKCSCDKDGANWKRHINHNTEHESIQRLATVVKKSVPEKVNFVSGARSKNNFVDKLSEQLETMSFQKFSVVEQTMSISIWDFAGQYIYYATHQLFHSRKAVYLLVFNLCTDLDYIVEDADFPIKGEANVKTMGDYIRFWMNSIHSYVGNEDGTEPAVILVGTHADQLENSQDADKYFKSVRHIFRQGKLGFHIQKEHFAISATEPSCQQIESLQKAIVSIGMRQKAGEMIPAKWIPLERALKDRQNENIISLKEVLRIDKTNEYPIGNRKEVKSFLEFHHKSGTFFYFDEGIMSRHVIVNPQFLIHAFRCIITSQGFCWDIPKLRPLWETLMNMAFLYPELLHSVWQSESPELIKFMDILISYLKKHRIIGEAIQLELKDGHYNVRSRGFYIVPSLLRSTDDGSVQEFLEGKTSTPVSLVYMFESETIVPTIFQRITAAAIGTWPILEYKGNPLLFEDVSVYKINLGHAGLVLYSNNEIEIFVTSLCSEHQVSEVRSNYFRRFTELMIESEFQKLRPSELKENKAVPYKTAFRCLHRKHGCKGSIATYHLDLVRIAKEDDYMYISCPDNVSHESLCPASLLQLWFDDTIRSKAVPKKKLTDKEYSLLSTSGVGYGWKHLGFALDIPQKKLEQIDMNNHEVSMKIFTVFKTWEKINPESATLDKLVDIAKSLPQNIISRDTLNNIIDRFYSQPILI